MDDYRWAIFDGSISKNNLNAEWWKRRLVMMNVKSFTSKLQVSSKSFTSQLQVSSKPFTSQLQGLVSALVAYNCSDA